MPATQYHGDWSQLISMPGARMTFDAWGVASLAQRWECAKEDVFSLMPGDGDSHPEFPDLKNDLPRMEIEFTEATAVISCTYTAGVGLLNPNSTFDGSYDLSIAYEVAPIDTHPKFKEELGGTAANPLNGALFEEDGRFKGFPPDADGDLAGVQSYFRMQATWRRSWSGAVGHASMSDLGTITESPDGNPPAVSPGYNWLVAGYTDVKSGGVHRLTKEWKLSGSSGWNQKIYG